MYKGKIVIPHLIGVGGREGGRKGGREGEREGRYVARSVYSRMKKLT